MSKNYTFYNKL